MFRTNRTLRRMLDDAQAIINSQRKALSDSFQKEQETEKYTELLESSGRKLSDRFNDQVDRLNVANAATNPKISISVRTSQDGRIMLAILRAPIEGQDADNDVSAR